MSDNKRCESVLLVPRRRCKRECGHVGWHRFSGDGEFFQWNANPTFEDTADE